MFHRIDLHTEGLPDVVIRDHVKIDFVANNTTYRVSQKQLLEIVEAHYRRNVMS
jgi:hypothetical protein